MKNHVAYDYDNQQWVQGEPARLLAIKQLQHEIETLTGPNGDQFFNSCLKGFYHTKPLAINFLQRQISNLNRSE